MHTTKSLKEFKRDHKTFFQNKLPGERYNVHKGYLITTAYDWYLDKTISKVWKENEVGTLLPIYKCEAVSEAKDIIDGELNNE